MPSGKFYHDAIQNAAPMRAEHSIGWITHYVVGIGYAALMVLLWGDTWVTNPSLGPALVLGIVTVVAPLFILQPAMGAGIGASKTPAPNAARLHAFINHGVFGLGLYLSACIVKFIY